MDVDKVGMPRDKCDEPPEVKHPLLLEDVLDKVFPYLEYDVQNLCSSRLVCKTWNKAASRVVKKTLRWKIGAELENGQDEFTKLMAQCNSKEELLANFRICQLDISEREPLSEEAARKRASLGVFADQIELNEFMKLFGTFIVDLKLSSFDLCSYTAFLPNLEHLEVYDVSADFNEPPEPSNLIVYVLPQLKSLAISPAEHDPTVAFDEFANIKACSRIAAASPNLSKLQMPVPISTGRFLRRYNMELLTCLDIRHHDFAISLAAGDLKVIRKMCRHLTSFYGIVHGAATMEALYKMISSFSRGIKELYIELSSYSEDEFGMTDSDKSDDSDSDIDVDETFLAYQEKMRRLLFPRCPVLKSLTLRNWQLFNNFNFELPSLVSLDIELPAPPACSLPIIGPSDGQLNNVSRFRFRGPITNEGTLTALAAIFPHLTELDIELDSDEALHEIFKSMPGLKRLYLGSSDITDAGITGIPVHTLKLQFNLANPLGYPNADMDYLRRFPFIGDLKNLQHFTIDKHSLSKYSVHYGFTFLKELTYLKVPSYRNKNGENVEKVHVRALADSCPTLMTLDVTGFMPSDKAKAEPSDAIHVSWSEDCCLPDSDMEYLKEKLPYLHLICRPSLPLEDDEDLEAMPLICFGCGTLLGEDWNFCGNCGLAVLAPLPLVLVIPPNPIDDAGAVAGNMDEN